MSTKVIIPKSGMGIDEGTIGRWLKSEGERVSEGEIIVEIESAKAIVEVPAPTSGVLAKILLKAGETAEIFTEIGVIEER